MNAVDFPLVSALIVTHCKHSACECVLTDASVSVAEEVMLAEEDKNAEEKSLDGAWYKKKHSSGGSLPIQNLILMISSVLHISITVYRV